MNNTTNMSATFETAKNRKAFTYTTIICAAILLIALLVSWKLPQHPPKVLDDLIEINLGNDEEGYGEVQPLIKGEKAPASESAPQQQSAAATNQNAEDFKADENTDNESAPVTKPVKTTTKVKTSAPVVVAPAPKPKKTKASYPGTTNGKGNGTNEDNGYTMQGNNPGGKGDAGSPNGKPDSYGNKLGGKTGGLKIEGDRKIINHYYFQGDLPKATVKAIIRISPEGKGTFLRIDAKGSTSTDSKYANDIMNKLPSIQFDKADHVSNVTITFNFTVGG